MTTRRTLRRAALLWLAGLVGIGGCLAFGGGDIDPETSERALREQHHRVGAELRSLMAGTGKVPGQVVISSQGRWLGCESTFTGEFSSFRYSANLRLRLVGSAERVAPRLVRVARAAGWAVVPGPRDRPDAANPDHAEWVRASKDGLTAALADLAPGAQEDVLLQVSAVACVDVPEGRRDDLLARDAPDPLED